MTGSKRTETATGISISVIVPVRNGERTIDGCLGSILDQSIRDFEVVVVDNASDDATRTLVEKYSKKDPRIRYVFESRLGRGNARSCGIECSRGSILAWTDSDCVVPHDWLEKLTTPIIEGREVIVQGGEDPITDGYWSIQAQIAGERHRDCQMKSPPYIDHIDTKNLGIRKDILLKVGGFDKRLKALEDYELKIRLKIAGKKIFYLKDLRVKHHHREGLKELFRSRFEQGYWATVIFYIHKDFFRSEKGEDSTIKSMYIFDILMFPVHLMLFLVRRGPREFLFEALTGYIWRWGNLIGRFTWRKTLEGSND